MTFTDIAPLVGLNPHISLRDTLTFKLPRVPMPTSIFKDIIGDLHVALNQYGPHDDRRNEEARSRFIAPVSATNGPGFSLATSTRPTSYLCSSWDGVFAVQSAHM